MKLGLISAAVLLAAAQAQAVPTTTAIGTTSVLGTVYNVSLLYDSAGNWDDQSFDDLMPSITFTTEAAATAAAIALRDTFGAAFDWTPADPGVLNGTRIAMGFDAVNFQYMTVSDCCGAPFYYGPFEFPRNDSNVFSFAQFAPVPEPETYTLMLLGLAGLGALRRRKS